MRKAKIDPKLEASLDDFIRRKTRKIKPANMRKTGKNTILDNQFLIPGVIKK